MCSLSECNKLLCPQLTPCGPGFEIKMIPTKRCCPVYKCGKSCAEGLGCPVKRISNNRNNFHPHPFCRFFFVQCPKMSASTMEPSTRYEPAFLYLSTLFLPSLHSMISVTLRGFLTCTSACLQPGQEFDKNLCTHCHCTKQRDPKTIHNKIQCAFIACAPCAVVRARNLIWSVAQLLL